MEPLNIQQASPPPSPRDLVHASNHALLTSPPPSPISVSYSPCPDRSLQRSIFSEGRTPVGGTMAISDASTPQPLKRPAPESSEAMTTDPPFKRPRLQQPATASIHRQRRHQIHHTQKVPFDAVIRDDEARTLLTRSLSLALKAAGFDGTEELVMESLRARVEECTLIPYATKTTQSEC
jgi:hypothetical protein